MLPLFSASTRYPQPSRPSCPGPGKTAASSWASTGLTGASTGACPLPAARSSATSLDYDRSFSFPDPLRCPVWDLFPWRAEALSASTQSNKCLQNWVVPCPSVAPREKDGSTRCQLHALAVPHESVWTGAPWGGSSYTSISLGLPAG